MHRQLQVCLFRLNCSFAENMAKLSLARIDLISFRFGGHPSGISNYKTLSG